MGISKDTSCFVISNRKYMYQSFSEFYSFYLKEHKDPRCRFLHYVGSTSVLVLLIWVLLTHNYVNLMYLPIVGYGFAWMGHVLFEKNKPATFKHPLYSFLADWVMCKEALLSLFGVKTKLSQFKDNNFT